MRQISSGVTAAGIDFTLGVAMLDDVDSPSLLERILVDDGSQLRPKLSLRVEDG